MKIRMLVLITIMSSSAYAENFIGTYQCKGYDPYLKKDYAGTVLIEQQNTVYKITMKYDTGQKYHATGGQYNNELLSVVFQDEKDLKRVGLEQYQVQSDKKTMGGFWVYLGKDLLGQETCIRQDDNANPA